ncbi:hypothetical protein F8568_032250 [Actinomadura sp. LD22]|uniref:Uncharacterized protein n=1 Tax=Actinomadura physcomitrii TaxID=2650748 RepID=A0A6I4MLW3_9ACTN|nr:hypothetical protein [Actinomadura physcomitrii]MWA04957.1 hypothetical protein [Actinomadura physcomitrii]
MLQPGLKFVDFGGHSTIVSGDDPSITVGLNGTAPAGGMVVDLESDNPALQVPASMTIPQGALGMDVPRPKSSRIPTDADVTVTANIEGVGSRSQTVRVRPGIIGLDIRPWSVTGGEQFEGTVRLGTTTSEPVTVRLDSDDPAVQPPAEVTIPAGQSSVTFQGTTSPVTDLAFATVTAAIPGGSRWQTDLLVEPAS